MMETVRDVDIWLALHEGPLCNEKQLHEQNTVVLFHPVYTRNQITGRIQVDGACAINLNFKMRGFKPVLLGLSLFQVAKTKRDCV